MLRPVLASVLESYPDTVLVLLGPGSKEFRNELTSVSNALTSRVMATGALTEDEVSAHLGCCDVLLQPYPDGVNGRRGSVMAALAHGKPVVTTDGRATERIWLERRPVSLVKAEDSQGLCHAVGALLSNPLERDALGMRAAKLYQEMFDIRHTLDALTAAQVSK